MTRRRVRVLHIVQNLNYGGMERVVSDLILHSDTESFEQHLLCLQYLGRFSEGLERVAELHVATPMSRLSMVNPVGLARDIRRIAPDVVHTHSGVWYKASLASRKAGVRALIHTEHGRRSPDPLLDRVVDGAAARRTDAVVAVSERLARELPGTLRMSPDRVVCIPNGIDTEVYRPRPDSGALRRELGLAPEVQIVGSIGRLEPIKAYDTMVAAFARFSETDVGRRAVLVIGGDGSERPALERQIDQLGIRGRVRLLGWRNDIHDLLSAFSLFSMSSRSEGTSISLLEAMSAGLPPVVTDVGGNSAVLGDALPHCLVPFGDTRALSEAWNRILATSDSQQAASALARRRVVDAFGVGAVARRYEQLYARIAPINAQDALMQAARA
jgi:glycosyltransferase involved in cell wall biosynthesis